MSKRLRKVLTADFVRFTDLMPSDIGLSTIHCLSENHVGCFLQAGDPLQVLTVSMFSVIRYGRRQSKVASPRCSVTSLSLSFSSVVPSFCWRWRQCQQKWSFSLPRRRWGLIMTGWRLDKGQVQNSKSYLCP